MDQEKDPNMSGWDAIATVFDNLYPLTLENTKQYGVLIPWCLGGPSPLDNVRAYDGGDYWHFVTFGLSELYEKEWEDKEVSSWGMEFTFKLKKADYADEEAQIRCVVGILQDLAKLTMEDRELFQPFEYIYTGQKTGFDAEGTSALTGFITVPEPMAGPIETPNGSVAFLELVGVTDAELQGVMAGQLRVRELYEKLGTDVTDYARPSLL